MTAAGSEPQTSLLLRVTSRCPLLLIAGWMILYLPRPFQLGLYSDDWWALIEPQHATAPFSWDRLRYFVGFQTNYGPRPLMGFTAFLVTSITGTSPAAIQFASALLVLAAALSLRAWLNRFMSVIPEYRNELGDFAAVFWLSVPWMMGETAWPNVVHNLGAQLFLTEIARLLLARERMTAGLAAYIAAAITASGLIYEAFYFWIFPIVLLYAVCGRGPARKKRSLAVLLGICGLAQVLPIAFNRWAAYIHAAVTKTFNPGWPSLLEWSLRSLPEALGSSLPEYHWLARALVMVLCAGTAAVYLSAVAREQRQRLSVYIPAILATAAVLLMVSSAIYSMAGYAFVGVGLDSRTLYPVSLSFAVAFFALLCCLFLTRTGIVRGGLLAVAGGLILVLALAQHYRVAEWAHVWQEELRILNGAPVSEIERLPSGSAILYVGPWQYKGVRIFGAPWELTAAVFSRSPLNKNRRPYQGMIQIYPATGMYQWSWDGETLVMTLPQYWVQKFPAARLYVWKQGLPGLQAVERGFRWPPQQAGTLP